MGVDLALDVRTSTVAQAQRELGMREGFDVGLEMSGHPSALPDMIENMNHGGRIAMLGLPSQPIGVDWARVVSHMLTIKGIYGREMFETWYAMSAMLSSSQWLRNAVAAVVTDRFAAAGLGQGLRYDEISQFGQGCARLDRRSEERHVRHAHANISPASSTEIRDAGLYKHERTIDTAAVLAHRLRRA